MSQLADFPLIFDNLRKARKDAIVALHKFVFESEGDRNNRQRLR